MKSLKFTAIALIATVAPFFVSQMQAQPVLSEYVEGSGNNKCIEIWNPSAGSVDLGAYGYRAYHNGSSTPTYQFALPPVTLAAGEVYVICHPSADIDCRGNADTTDNRILFNGDDAVAVYDTTTGNNVDIFGSIGQDPGSYWTGACGHRTSDRTLRRLSTAVSGVTGASTGFPTLCSNWQLFSEDDCTDLGSAPSEEELTCFPIISEYVEGTGNCKFIEVYNPCCDAINLSAFEIRIHFNACTSTYAIPLAGILPGNSLASGGTVVLYNPNETCSSYYVSGVYPSNFMASNSVQHNGNDAIVLVYTADGSNVDIFGNICENTVWADAVCGASTENQTLSRKAAVCAGVTTDPTTGFPTLCSEWDVLSVNTVSGLGSHTSDCLDACDAGKAGLATAAEAAGPSIVAYPNPFTGSTTLRFQVAETTPAQVEVYSLTGAKMASLFQGTAEAGRVYQLTFDASDLPAGSYLYRLVAGSEQRYGKVMLAR